MSFVISDTNASHVYSDGVNDSAERVQEILDKSLNDSDENLTLLKTPNGETLVVYFNPLLEKWTVLTEGQVVIKYHAK